MSEDVKTLQDTVAWQGRVIAAAIRLLKNNYTPWANAGGLYECKHGYTEGIPCPKCDAKSVDEYAEL